MTLIAGPENNQRAISGWTEIRVTRGIERVPSDFEIGLTELFPGEASEVVVQPGDPCRVMIGEDLVLTGYIDRFIPSYSAGQHTIRVMGRGKCEDLVDCAAIWKSGQIANASTLSIAKKLAAPYGVNVTSTAGSGKIVPQMNINWSETVFEAIERLARFSAMLVYELPDGNLLLSQAGTNLAASGFTEGKNVQGASIEYSMDERYSDYVVSQLSMDVLQDVGQGGFITATFTDSGVPRKRVRYVIVESGDSGGDIAKQRGAWEAARRRGRSQQVRITADNWRDASGVLWTPNTLAPIHLPGLKLKNQMWLIDEVTFIRGEQGSTAELLIMPPAAFLVEPILAPWEAGLMDIPVNPGK
ncbi:MAG: hypothetical protein KGI54_10435 [Pseudomonadota bacterium]|nr:hypothetical protein [Pseudomonadota bacterium]